LYLAFIKGGNLTPWCH